MTDQSSLTRTLSAVFPWAVLLCCLGISCAPKDLAYREQVDLLVDELGMQSPQAVEDVCDFVALRSCRLNLRLEGLTDTLSTRLSGEGPWYGKVLAAYLLALSRDPEGFAAIIRALEEDSPSPMVVEGVKYSGMKFLGMTERDRPPELRGRGGSLRDWKDTLDSIRKIGLPAWRRDYIKRIVLSGSPDSGDEALAASEWLAFTMEVSDVPFLLDMLERGSSKCDQALLRICETLLVKKFIEEESDEALSQGIASIRAWYEENAGILPSYWITSAYAEAGYIISDVYKQSALVKIGQVLLDNSEQWVVFRSHTLAIINQTCGFNVDRSVIFMPPEAREEVIQACNEWYEELAGRITVD